MVGFAGAPLYVVETTPMLTLAAQISLVTPLGDVIRFGPDGAVVPPAAGGGVETLEVLVPRLEGLTELIVDRAVVEVQGRAVDLPPLASPKTDASAATRVRGGAGGLRRVELRGLAVDPSAVGDDVVLRAGSGSTTRWHWQRTDEGIERDTDDLGHPLHLMVRPTGNPPVAAAPPYAMPDNPAGLYGPVLAGATLRLDEPATGSATLTFDPPVAAVDAELFLGANPDQGAHGGLPNEAVGVGWTATEVVATWAAAPHDVILTAASGGASVTVAQLAGELAPSVTEIDLTPAARAVLGDALAGGESGSDLVLRLAATSSTAGELAGGRIRLDARYRHLAVGPDGVALELSGTPETAALALPPGLLPAQLTMTVDGRFGPARLVLAADDPDPATRTGVLVTGPHRVARRIALSGIERNRPLARVGLLCAADRPTELLVEVCADAAGRPGAPIGDPVTLRLEPASASAWQRAPLSERTAEGAAAVWVVARATTGRARWYGAARDDAGAGATDVLVSLDDAATWDVAGVRPAVQLHVLTDPEPEPLSLHWPHGRLAEDVLALPATRTRIEAPALTAALLAGAVPAAVAGSARSASFRVEGATPVAASDLPLLAPGGTVPLAFACRRDVSMRLLDVEATYDPWRAR